MTLTVFKSNGSLREFYNFRSFLLFYKNVPSGCIKKVELTYKGTNKGYVWRF